MMEEIQTWNMSEETAHKLEQAVRDAFPTLSLYFYYEHCVYDHQDDGESLPHHYDYWNLYVSQIKAENWWDVGRENWERNPHLSAVKRTLTVFSPKGN